MCKDYSPPPLFLLKIPDRPEGHIYWSDENDNTLNLNQIEGFSLRGRRGTQRTLILLVGEPIL